MKRPISATFGFGGKLVSVSNLPSAQGKNQSSVVHLRSVVTEEEFVSRAKTLHDALVQGSDAVQLLAQEKKNLEGGETWQALLSLFQADSRDELVTLLGFDKSEIKAKVQDAVERLKLRAATPSGLVSPSAEGDTTFDASEMRPPVVSFADPPESHRDLSPSPPIPEGDGLTPSEKTPSEYSERIADGESTTTVPSLFGDDNDAPGTPQNDFFSNLTSPGGTAGTGESPTPLVPHTNYGIDSSVAATIGSRPSSIASASEANTTKHNTFHIYPAGTSEEAETEKLVTKALVLGDFESAVELCLSVGRYADAILFAARGGQELMVKTQNAYFAKHTTSDGSSLRLFQSIVQNDLADIVQNADLDEWKEIFVVLCTFVPAGEAGKEEFASLVEELGRRLEFQFTMDKESDEHGMFGKYATLTYLAAGRLERLVGIWVDEMVDQEKELAKTQTESSAHANALQSFVEKIAVFQAATKYVDVDLSSTTKGVVYKLASLYDRYFDYAELLASQGLVKEAAGAVGRIPRGYDGGEEGRRERLVVGAAPVAATKPAPTHTGSAFAAATVRGNNPYVSAAPAGSGYGPAPTAPGYTGVPAAPGYAAAPPASGYAGAPPATGYAPQQQGGYNAFSQAPPAPAPTSSAYAPPPSTTAPNQGPYASGASSGPYGAPQAPYGHAPPPPAHNLPPPPTGAMIPPPPRAGGSSTTPVPPGPPPPAKPKTAADNGGWNDAPVMANTNAAARALANKSAAITSPFPNSPSPGFASSPPPRPGSRGVNVGPPPRGGMGTPNRVVSPPGANGAAGQWAPPPPPSSRIPGQTPPPAAFARPSTTGSGPYARATPPPAPSAYAPPPQANAGSYGPPPVQQQQGQYGPPPTNAPTSFDPFSHPPPSSGQYAPPPPAAGAPQRGVPPVGAPPPVASAPPKSAPVARGPPPPKYRKFCSL